MIQTGKARCVDSANTVCVQEYHVHLNVDGLCVLPADFRTPRVHHFMHPWSVRRRPIRFERMATVLITDCVHTLGDCTRASYRWCASNHPWVALAASTPSHLLRTRRGNHNDHWSKQISKFLEEATFPEQCTKNSIRDDSVRPFSQLVVWKCLSFVFLHSHLLRWGWVFLERTRILSGIQFTTYFIEFFVVETKRFVCSFVNVILRRQTCGQSSRAAKSKRRALGNHFSERICYMFLISKCKGD